MRATPGMPDAAQLLKIDRFHCIISNVPSPVSDVSRVCDGSELTEHKMAKKFGPEENYWSPFQQDVMKMVQRHPITYIRDIMMTPTQYKAALTTAWDRIARDIRMPRKSLLIYFVICL